MKQGLRIFKLSHTLFTKEQSLRQSRKNLLQVILVLELVAILVFLVTNLITGRTFFLANNSILIAITLISLFLLHRNYYRAAMLVGIALYSFELQIFICLTHQLFPFHYSNYAFNLNLVLGLSAILGAAFLSERSKDFAFVYIPSVLFIIADYFLINQTHFAPAYISLLTLLIMSGIAALLFIRISTRMKLLIEEKNNLLIELSQEKELAEHALRLKSSFFSSVSHDLRTPLFAIRGFTELLAQEIDPERKTEIIGAISTSTEVMVSLVDSILDLNKLENPSARISYNIIPLKQLSSNMHTIFAGLAAEKKLELGVFVDPSLPLTIIGDRNLLDQILINLLSNAVKFTTHGSVRLEITPFWYNNDRGIMFSVIDTGVGISKEQAERIFDEFYQIETGGNNGFGLGLAICKRSAQLLDGQISLESEPGRGSRFKLVLSLRPGPENAPAVNIKHSISSASAMRVLVADDNQINRTLLSGFCEALKIGYTCVEDGKQAIEEYSTGNYDTVVLDLHMPGKNGLETAQEIRLYAAKQKFPPPLIIAVTADNDFVSNFDPAESPFDNALLKPFSLDEFSHAIILIQDPSSDEAIIHRD